MSNVVTPENEAAANRPLTRSELVMIARLHGAILIFYVVDALLLTLLALLHAVSFSVGWRYGVAGLSLAGLLIAAFHRGRRDTKSLSTYNIALSLIGSLLMLLTALRVPAVGGLMLMSMMTVLAASALQLGKRQLLTVYLASAGGAAGVLMMVDVPLQWPMLTPWQRGVTALWFAWLLAKCTATNVAGTQLRQWATQANTQLAAALTQIEKVASIDDLTLLPNRRSIISILGGALESLQGRPGFVGVALFDIDHFKSVNDRFGHATGDEVLRAFGSLVSQSLRPNDMVGRYGGEEFLLVLQDVRGAQAARDAADRMRKAVERHDWSGVADGLAITASAGVALIGAGEDSRTAVQRADAALYAAKAAGRNRVILG